MGLCSNKDDYLSSPKKLDYIKAEITSNHSNFCFATCLDSGEEIFIPKKFSKNSVIGDTVLLKVSANLGGDIRKNLCKTGKVVAVCSRKDVDFVGTVIALDNKFFVKADKNFDRLFKIENKITKLKNNSKVLAKLMKKNFDLDNPSCKIIKVYGNSTKADICVDAYLDSCNIPIKFSKPVLKDTEKIKLNKNQISRKDLTDQIIFTIDGKNAKDLDDAVSIKKTADDHYIVGVHIADVSSYVEFKSKIDIEALKRSNSIYIANRVIPMLAPKLSNNICSLQPRKFRLTFSVIMELDLDGKLINFKLEKTKIRSIVKGVYEEINKLLNSSDLNNQSKKLLKKYEKVFESIKLLSELCKKLKERRIKKGSPQLESTECEIKLNKNNIVTSITAKKQHEAENMIEELMILANECVAKFAKMKKIPIFYRTHDKPTMEKIDCLKQLLQNLELNSAKIKYDIKPKVLANLLEESKKFNLHTLINLNILRTMSKAQYNTEPLSHFGLASKNYTHFTSPIRRYCDLTVHRILSEYIDGEKPAKLNKKYGKFLEKSTEQINSSEKKAIKIERDCEDYYKAEFMKNKIGKKFEAIITNCNKNGMFIQLENTISGFIKIESLKQKYQFDGFFKLINKNGGSNYIVGQKIVAKCVSVNVNAKTIDFEITD